jgi:phage repressor protein C with HTH and peptisase S24 domain
MSKTPHPHAAERLKHLRERSGLSMAEIARAVGYRGASSYQRYEDPELFPKKYLPLDLAEKLARALAGRGSPPISREEVMAMAGRNMPEPRMIPVVGYVGAGAEVFSIDDHAKGAGLDEVECPWSDLAPSSVAVRVRGDSMAPAYFDGDLIYYEENHTDFRHLIGKECVVAITDGRRFVKQLRRTAAGQWYLFSHNAEPIFGVEIEWAARVKLIQRGG